MQNMTDVQNTWDGTCQIYRSSVITLEFWTQYGWAGALETVFFLSLFPLPLKESYDQAHLGTTESAQ